MSPRGEVLRVVQDGFPRVSGDEPWSAGSVRMMSRFSPRERG